MSRSALWRTSERGSDERRFKMTGKDIKPVLFIYGTEDYLVDEEVEAVKRGCLTEGFEELNLHVYEAKGLDVDAALVTAGTLPAFSARRVVVIRGAESLKAADAKKLAGYAEDPSPTTCLVLVAGTGKVNRNTALFKLLSSRGAVRCLGRLKDRELLVWIRKEAKRQGKDITESAARRLLAIAGTRLRDLKGELDKIILYAWDSDRIDDSDVDGVGLDCREETIFGLSDAIGVRDLKEAMRIYAKVSGEPPLVILGAMARQVRMLLKLKSLVRRKVPAATLPARLGIRQWLLDGYMRRSRLFTEEELKHAVRKLSEADISLKTGRIPRDLVVTGLILDLCSAHQPRG